MKGKLFGIDIVDLYNYNIEKAYNFVKDNTNYLYNIDISKVKDIKFSANGDIIILLYDGIVSFNGKKISNNIRLLAFMSGLSIFAINQDNVINCLNDCDSFKFINNNNYKYRKIIVTPLVIVALTYEKDIRLFGTLVDQVVDYHRFIDVDDIGYVLNNDDIVVIKNDKVYSLFHDHNYSNEKPDVLFKGYFDDVKII